MQIRKCTDCHKICDTFNIGDPCPDKYCAGTIYSLILHEIQNMLEIKEPRQVEISIKEQGRTKTIAIYADGVCRLLLSNTNNFKLSVDI